VQNVVILLLAGFMAFSDAGRETTTRGLIVLGFTVMNIVIERLGGVANDHPNDRADYSRVLSTLRKGLLLSVLLFVAAFVFTLVT
jgi:hypothetical protein